MAKDEPAGDYEFQPPNFDEDAFIHRELVSFRTTAILFVWGIIAAAVSWGLYVAVDGGDSGWWLGLAVCVAAGFALKLLFPKLGADVSHFTRANWFGTGFMFFCTWLSFFMLAINPPITDFAPPEVGIVASPAHQEAGATLTFEVLATDNGHLRDGVHSVLTKDGKPFGGNDARTERLADGHFRIIIPAAGAGTYSLMAWANDTKGHHAEATTTATVGTAIRVDGDKLLGANDRILVTVVGEHACTPADVQAASRCIRAVRLIPTEAPGQAVTLGPKDAGTDGDRWEADAQYKGWLQGNHTYTVAAEHQDTYLGAERVPGANITATTKTIQVAIPTGDKAAEVLPQPAGRSIPLSAPAALFALAAVLGAAMVVRAKRDD